MKTHILLINQKNHIIMHEILIDTRNDRDAVRAKQLLDIINKSKDLNETSVVTICVGDGEDDFRVLNLVYVCSSCSAIHFNCTDEEDELSDLINANDVIHSNVFVDFTSAIEVKKILESDKINPDAPILISTKKGVSFPLNMVRRCDSKKCLALHLDCYAADDEYDDNKNKLPDFKLN